MSDRVRLTTPGPEDRDAFLAAVRRSHGLHSPWVSPPETAVAYRAHLDKLDGVRNVGFLVRDGADALVGVINLSEIVRGVFQSAYLGYYAFEPHAGRGFMSAAMALVITDAFGPLALHRLEANIQPANAASLALVRRLGFGKEGFSPRYLKIRGQWRDHERWALCAEDWRGPGDAPSSR